MKYLVYRLEHTSSRVDVAYLVRVRPEHRRPYVESDVEYTYSTAWSGAEATRYDAETAVALALTYDGMIVEVIA